MRIKNAAGSLSGLRRGGPSGFMRDLAQGPHHANENWGVNVYHIGRARLERWPTRKQNSAMILSKSVGSRRGFCSDLSGRLALEAH